MDIVSCCGIMCSECPVFIAALRDDDTMKKYLAHEYSLGGQVFYPKDISCRGCRDASSEHNKFCKGCEIRKCCRENYVRICAECRHFPCEKINSYSPEGSEQRDRLNEMHEACKGLIDREES